MAGTPSTTALRRGRLRRATVVLVHTMAPPARFSTVVPFRRGRGVNRRRPCSVKTGKAPRAVARAARQQWRETLMVTRIVTAVAALVSAYVHLKLWLDGFSDIDMIGPAFMFNAVAGLVIAILLLAWKH